MMPMQNIMPMAIGHMKMPPPWKARMIHRSLSRSPVEKREGSAVYFLAAREPPFARAGERPGSFTHQGVPDKGISVRFPRVEQLTTGYPERQQPKWKRR
jgi:hypothetical protein